MQLKHGVNINDLCPIMRPALDILERIHQDLKIPFIITSTRDGIHSHNSLHWENHAFDFRSYAPTNARLRDAAHAKLPHYYILRIEGLMDMHFHLEFHTDLATQ